MRPRKIISNVFFRIIPIQFKTTPIHDVIVILMGGVLGLLLALNVVVMQNLFDAVIVAVENKCGMRACVLPVLGLAGTTMGVEMIQGVFNFQGEVIFKKSAGDRKSTRLNSSHMA